MLIVSWLAEYYPCRTSGIADRQTNRCTNRRSLEVVRCSPPMALRAWRDRRRHGWCADLQGGKLGNVFDIYVLLIHTPNQQNSVMARFPYEERCGLVQADTPSAHAFCHC
jgi:hypothetical protein